MGDGSFGLFVYWRSADEADASSFVTDRIASKINMRPVGPMTGGDVYARAY